MSVSDRRFRRVVLLSCLLGALLLAELAAGADWAAAFAVGAMLFPAAAAALQGLFLESATKAVEAATTRTWARPTHRAGARHSARQRFSPAPRSA